MNSFGKCMLILLLLCVYADSQDTRNGAHLTRLAPVSDTDTALDVDLLRVGKPLVGVVEPGQTRFIHFGVLPRGKRFPDITLYLEAANADVYVYCMPYHRMSTDHLPNQNTALWKSTKQGELFISSKGKHYHDSVVVRRKNEQKYNVAGFGCAIHSAAGDVTEFQIAVRLSFDDRILHPEHESALREIYKECCAENNHCHRWLYTEQKLDDGTLHQLDEPDYDFCHRTGSFCNDKGDLIRLSLRSYGLKCKLPVVALQKLSTLEALDLYDNGIHADVTEDVARLGSLRNLKELNLAHNYVHGEIQSRGFCTELLKNLKIFDLRDNYISGHIPSCVFTDNYLMEEIYLARNRFSGYISDLFPASSPLQALDISGNELAGLLPASLGRLKALKVLSLSGNSFNGKIPEPFSFMRNLEVLDLSQNRLSSFPTSWYSSWEPPTFLRVVNFRDNKLGGKLPTRLLRSRNLEWLDLSVNYLSGTLFAKKGMFPKMTYFNVSMNHIDGSIPEDMSSMGLFQKMDKNGPRQIFDVSFNDLKGEIPEFMYQESTPSISATELYLQGNELSCHQWKTLNSIPNFECTNHPHSNAMGDSTMSSLLKDEDAQRRLISTMAKQNDTLTVLSSTASEMANSDRSSSSGGKKSAANAIVGVVTALLSGAVLAGIVVLVFKFCKSRSRRMGLQYGAPDEDESDEEKDVEHGLSQAAAGTSEEPSAA